MTDDTHEGSAEKDTPAVDRRRWRSPRSPLASSVSPALRDAVRRLDETRARLHDVIEQQGGHENVSRKGQ